MGAKDSKPSCISYEDAIKRGKFVHLRLQQQIKIKVNKEIQIEQTNVRSKECQKERHFCPRCLHNKKDKKKKKKEK